MPPFLNTPRLARPGLIPSKASKTYNISASGDAAKVAAQLRRGPIQAPAVVTVNVADGTYTDVDSTFGNDAWLDLTGVVVEKGAELKIVGNAGTPSNVLIDGGGSTTNGLYLAASGNGKVVIDGIKFDDFSTSGVVIPKGTILGILELKNIVIDNSPFAMSMDRCELQECIIDTLTISNALFTAIFAQAVAGLMTFRNIDVGNNASLFGAAIEIDSCQYIQFENGCNVHDNSSGKGIAIYGASVVIFICSSGALTVDDNGGTGIELIGCGRCRFIESGSGEIIINRNSTIGINAISSFVEMTNVDNGSNVSAAPQATGIQADANSAIKKTGSMSIKGTSTNENAINGGVIY